MDLGVTVELGAPTRVALAGDLDVGCVPFLEGLFGLLASAASPSLHLDLDRVGFMDCRGLRVLLTAHRLTAARGGVVRLDRASLPVRRVLQLTGTGFLLDGA